MNVDVFHQFGIGNWREYFRSMFIYKYTSTILWTTKKIWSLNHFTISLSNRYMALCSSSRSTLRIFVTPCSNERIKSVIFDDNLNYVEPAFEFYGMETQFIQLGLIFIQMETRAPFTFGECSHRMLALSSS